MLIIERLFFLAALAGLVLFIRRTRRLTERVESLRRMMSLAVIHDLKNPMTSIMGCVSCAMDDEMTAPQRHKLLSLALLGCKAQMTLLETLVDTDRLDSGDLPVLKADVPTKALIDDALDGVRGSAAYLGVALERDVAPSFPSSVRVDPNLFPRVILNLLHNALKYTPSGGSVVLRATARDGLLDFEVSDTGVGIPQASIARLFEKYYRVEGAEQEGRRGSGLGLYFCRLAVEAHGGTIRVKSGVGEGTSVLIGLPDGGGR